MNIWDTLSGSHRHSGRHGHRHHRSHGHSHGRSHGQPERPERPTIRSAHRISYAQVIVVLVAVALLGRLAWQGVKYLRHSPSVAASKSAPDAGATPPASSDPWLHDVLLSLDQSARAAETGDLSEAETDADRAGSVIVTMRLSSRPAPPDFFSAAVALLDRAASARSDNKLLFEHVTETRVELAELRSSMLLPPVVANPTSRVSPSGPRQVAAQQTLDPTTLGGSYVDATLMADTLEMLMPPVTRSFSDGVSVHDLTFAGAAQTLDGVRWRNITFISTHLRYEGGPLDLQNVNFARCRFGFVSDERGARLANAIALGQTSITIE